MADFDVQLTASGVEFTPRSDRAWEWLRSSGKVANLSNNRLIRDAASARVLGESLVRRGLILNDIEAASGRAGIVPTIQQVESHKATISASEAAPEMSAVDKWANSTGGCFTLIGTAIVVPILLFLGFCSGSKDGPASNDKTEYSAEDQQRQRKAAEHDEAKYAAENNLKALLKDADSAKYEGVFLSRIEGGNLMLCGKVNSKNSFGAFVGFKRFIASPNPSAPTLVEGQRSGLGAAVDSSFAPAYAAVCSNPVERY
ncbi:hypothetical protein [Sphingobium sp. HWE2-09]|uniref:hypothetical protein n=1 Tax=Sphingobium sp. HWE2-09 TaxID=3108390 RepID=UPI002DC43C11|nr:hypothetical protein [Sphingobium sp. HWE2-09]